MQQTHKINHQTTSSSLLSHQPILFSITSSCFSSFSNSKVPLTTSPLPPPNHSSCISCKALKQPNSIPTYSDRARFFMRSRQHSGSVLRQIWRWSMGSWQSWFRSWQNLRQSLNSMSFILPCLASSFAKIYLSATMLLQENKCWSFEQVVFSRLWRWLLRVSNAQFWKVYAQRWGSSQYACKRLWFSICCHWFRGSGATTRLGSRLESRCSSTVFPLPMLPSIEQTICFIKINDGGFQLTQHTTAYRLAIACLQAGFGVGGNLGQEMRGLWFVVVWWSEQERDRKDSTADIGLTIIVFMKGGDLLKLIACSRIFCTFGSPSCTKYLKSIIANLLIQIVVIYRHPACPLTSIQMVGSASKHQGLQFKGRNFKLSLLTKMQQSKMTAQIFPSYSGIVQVYGPLPPSLCWIRPVFSSYACAFARFCFETRGISSRTRINRRSHKIFGLWEACKGCRLFAGIMSRQFKICFHSLFMYNHISLRMHSKIFDTPNQLFYTHPPHPSIHPIQPHSSPLPVQTISPLKSQKEGSLISTNEGLGTNSVRKGVKVSRWSDQEQAELDKIHDRIGNNWVQIGKMLNKEANQVKNRYYNRLRRGLKVLNQYIKSRGLKHKPFTFSLLVKLAQHLQDKFASPPNPHYQLALQLKNELLQLSALCDKPIESSQEARIAEVIEQLRNFCRKFKKRTAGEGRSSLSSSYMFLLAEESIVIRRQGRIELTRLKRLHKDNTINKGEAVFTTKHRPEGLADSGKGLAENTARTCKEIHQLPTLTPSLPPKQEPAFHLQSTACKQQLRPTSPIQYCTCCSPTSLLVCPPFITPTYLHCLQSHHPDPNVLLLGYGGLEWRWGGGVRGGVM